MRFIIFIFILINANISFFALSKEIVSKSFNLDKIEVIKNNELKTGINNFFNQIQNNKPISQDETIETIQYQLINFLSIANITSNGQEAKVTTIIKIWGKKYIDIRSRKEKIIHFSIPIEKKFLLHFKIKNKKFILNTIPEFFPIQYLP